MIFTGKNLMRVRGALELAKAELHNQVATCPDVNEYEQDIDDYEQEIGNLQKLCDRIDKKHPELFPQ